MDLLVLPADDIGPEITAATMSVLQRANAVFSLDLRFETQEIGMRDKCSDLIAAAKAIELAVDSCLADPATRTADIGGGLGTGAFAAAVLKRLEKSARQPVAA